LEKRDALLASMTDEVAELVLRDNILQTQALTIEQAQGVKLLDSHMRLIHQLEKLGLLDRAIEFLPSDKQLGELKIAGKCLTRPELAVLLSYSKMARYKSLLESDLPDDEYFIHDLKNYFPHAMREEFLRAITNHPLKREIIATVVTNDIVNHAGTGFTFNMAVDMSVSMRDVTAAYVITRELFNLPQVWEKIESEMLAGKQTDLIAGVQKFLERTIFWLLRNNKLPLNISGIIKDLAPEIAKLKAGKDTSLEDMLSVFDIIKLSRETKKSLENTGKVFAEIGSGLKFDMLLSGTRNLDTDSHFDRLAAQAMLGDLYDEQRRIAGLVIQSGKTLEEWKEARQEISQRYENFLAESRMAESVTLPKLMVALRYLRSFV
jgi:glutamate dehydrogenase